MKLYNVPRETYVKVLEESRPSVGCNPINVGEILFFDHIDGMYSFCMDKDKKNILHLSAFTEVEILDPQPK